MQEIGLYLFMLMEEKNALSKAMTLFSHTQAGHRATNQVRLKKEDGGKSPRATKGTHWSSVFWKAQKALQFAES